MPASPPTIAVTQPANGATVSGTVTVQGTASDAVGLKTVLIAIDGGATAAAGGLQNWSYALDTTQAAKRRRNLASASP